MFNRVCYTYWDPKLEPFLIYKRQWQSLVPNVHTSFPSTKQATSSNNTHTNLIKYSDHPPPSAKAKNKWSYTSTHPICHHGLKMDKFTLTVHQEWTNSAARTPRKLNFIWWCLIFVGTQYGTCFMSPFRHLEFWGGSYIFGYFMHLSHDTFC